MNVRDMMNRTPVKLGRSGLLGEALELMAQQKERHVVVVDESERVVGIVSDRDLAMYYDPQNMTPERWNEAKVEQLMSTDPVCIGSGDVPRGQDRRVAETCHRRPTLAVSHFVVLSRR